MDLTLDMLASFCIEDIDADIIHRAKSFWSAEGKLLTQSLIDINMKNHEAGTAQELKNSVKSVQRLLANGFRL